MQQELVHGANGELLMSSKIRVKLMSYLLLVSPDQEDDEDGEHDGSQAHDDEREVGDHGGDGQQLLHSCCRRIINHHALSRGNGKNLKLRTSRVIE